MSFQLCKQTAMQRKEASIEKKVEEKRSGHHHTHIPRISLCTESPMCLPSQSHHLHLCWKASVWLAIETDLPEVPGIYESPGEAINRWLKEAWCSHYISLALVGPSHSNGSSQNYPPHDLVAIILLLLKSQTKADIWTEKEG